MGSSILNSSVEWEMWLFKRNMVKEIWIRYVDDIFVLNISAMFYNLNYALKG